MYKYIKYIIFAAVIFMILEARFEIYILNYKGVVTDANIIDMRSTGSKGDISTHYSFFIGNKKYYSKSVNVKNHQVGDTLKIVYLESFPSVNESLVHLQKFK